MDRKSPPVVAIDFEWWNNKARDSVYQVGWAFWSDGKVDGGSAYVRPPRDDMVNVYPGTRDVIFARTRNAPPFSEVYDTTLKPLLERAEVVAAHNAQLDRSLLRTCCASFGLEMLDLDWLNTVMVARTFLNINPSGLRRVARILQFEDKHQHHDAGSDALAALRIVQYAVSKDGWDNVRDLVKHFPADVGNDGTLVSDPPVLVPPTLVPASRRGGATDALASLPEKERQVWQAVLEQFDLEWLTMEATLDPEDDEQLPRNELVGLWIESHDADLREMLAGQMRSDLQAACQVLGLDDIGYTKRLTSRLLAYAYEDAVDLQKERSGDGARPLRIALADLFTRAEILDEVRNMNARPVGFSNLSRADLQRLFVDDWDGDLADLLSRCYVSVLKETCDLLDIERPKLRHEMETELLRRYGTRELRLWNSALLKPDRLRKLLSRLNSGDGRFPRAPAGTGL